MSRSAWAVGRLVRHLPMSAWTVGLGQKADEGLGEQGGPVRGEDRLEVELHGSQPGGAQAVDLSGARVAADLDRAGPQVGGQRRRVAVRREGVVTPDPLRYAEEVDRPAPSL